MSRSVVRRSLTVVLALTLVAVAAPVVHPHHSNAPAFYDADCPLSQLAASGSEVGVPQVVDLIQPLPALGLALPSSSGNRSATSELLFSPRGPPVPA